MRSGTRAAPQARRAGPASPASSGPAPSHARSPDAAAGRPAHGAPRHAGGERHRTREGEVRSTWPSIPRRPQRATKEGVPFRSSGTLHHTFKIGKAPRAGPESDALLTSRSRCAGDRPSAGFSGSRRYRRIKPFQDGPDGAGFARLRRCASRLPRTKAREPGGKAFNLRKSFPFPRLRDIPRTTTIQVRARSARRRGPVCANRGARPRSTP